MSAGASGWGGSFQDLCRQSQRTLVLSARRLRFYEGLDKPWQVSTHALSGHRPDIAEGGLTFDPQSVQPRTWESSAGGFTVTVQGETTARYTLQRLALGSLIGIYAGRGTADPDAHSRVAMGQVVSFEWRGNQLVVKCAGIQAALRSRPYSDGDVEGEGRGLLFAGAGEATTLASDYTAGDGTVHLTSAAIMQFQAGGAGRALMTLTDSGDSFYIAYTGISGNDLTGCSAAGGVDFDIAAADPHTITNVAHLQEHPVKLISKVLLSTGTANFGTGAAGTNGALDTLPATWGYGFARDMVDEQGFSRVRRNVVKAASGSYAWNLLVKEPEPTALSSIRTWLAAHGAFLVQRQGQISIRAAQDPNEPRDALFYSITDELLSSWSFFPVDENLAGQYTDSNTDLESASSYAGPIYFRSLPFLGTVTRQLQGLVKSNTGPIGTEITERLGPWDCRCPALLRGTWAGLDYADLCPGDLVHVSTPRLRLFLPEMAATGAVLNRTPGMVTAHQVDWLRGTVSLDIHFLPST